MLLPQQLICLKRASRNENLSNEKQKTNRFCVTKRKAHFLFIFPWVTWSKFMYGIKCYFGSKISDWIFGVFKKILEWFLLRNLVTLWALTEIKTKRTFLNFWCRISWTKILYIRYIWTKWRFPNFLQFEKLSIEPIFVEKRYKVGQWVHYLKDTSSYFRQSF